MQTTLVVTGLLMGPAGGPHCVAMCGAACAGIGRTGGGVNTRSMWIFQRGRLLGYSTVDGIVAASIQGLGWLSAHAAALRPVRTLFHVAAAMLGLMLLWQAHQPVGCKRPDGRPFIRSGAAFARVLWALLPCGLLYSALLVAALTSSMLEGATVMALFALRSSVSLVAVPWLWLRLRKQGSGQWAIRLAGLALLASSVWALWMGLIHDKAPWRLTS